MMNIYKLSVVYPTTSKHLPLLYTRYSTKPICPVTKIPDVVTILNAFSKIGRNLALLLKQSPYIRELRLFDKSKDICIVAEDLSHIDTRTKIRSFGGDVTLKEAVTEADVVVTVGGCQEKANESVKTLFEKNVDSVRNETIHITEFSPNGIFCIARPPVEALVPLVSEEYKRAGVYHSSKIIGLTSVASMRANKIIANQTGMDPLKVLCPVIGGMGPNTTLTVISQCRPCAKINQDCQTRLLEVIAQAEENVLKMYGECTPVCLMPALAISRFINNLLRALRGECISVDCAFVRQIGHIGKFLPYMTSVVKLGPQGVISSHMPKLTGTEAYYLRKAAILIRENIQLGESFITGITNTENEFNKEIKAKCKLITDSAEENLKKNIVPKETEVCPENVKELDNK